MAQGVSGIKCDALKVIRLIVVCGLLVCHALGQAQRASRGDISSQAKSQPPLTIAAAADLSFAFGQIAQLFERQTGRAVRLSFGSSGNLFMQIENGAPFDLFLSADMEYPRKLLASGRAQPGTFAHYATGRLVVWVPADSGLALEREGIRALLDPALKRIAIANPQHAPYGRAAIAALQHFGVYEKLAAKLVLGENVSQAAQFVESGNAQAGMIALSMALAPTMKDKGRYWEVPAAAYPPLEQGAVVLKNSRNRDAAQRFLDFLKSSEAADILKRNGFAFPESAP